MKIVSEVLQRPHSCQKGASTPARFYVHRGSYKPKNGKYIPPVISCSARVEKIDRSSKHPIVYFKNAAVINKPVKRRLFFPLNSYYGIAP
jgi:hypothetical protein